MRAVALLLSMVVFCGCAASSSADFERELDSQKQVNASLREEVNAAHQRELRAINARDTSVAVCEARVRNAVAQTESDRSAAIAAAVREARDGIDRELAEAAQQAVAAERARVEMEKQAAKELAAKREEAEAPQRARDAYGAAADETALRMGMDIDAIFARGTDLVIRDKQCSRQLAYQVANSWASGLRKFGFETVYCENGYGGEWWQDIPSPADN